MLELLLRTYYVNVWYQSSASSILRAQGACRDEGFVPIVGRESVFKAAPIMKVCLKVQWKPSCQGIGYSGDD